MFSVVQICSFQNGNVLLIAKRRTKRHEVVFSISKSALLCNKYFKNQPTHN